MISFVAAKALLIHGHSKVETVEEPEKEQYQQKIVRMMRISEYQVTKM
jgi:hypothetical protein